MQVIKRLRIEEQECGFLLKDGETVYPIFQDSLHACFILDALLADGYIFCGLPYDFRKDSRSVLELTIEDYAPSGEELAMMYEILTVKTYPEEALKDFLVKTGPAKRLVPKSHITITTRARFLKYLDTYSQLEPESEFIPINYFVKPEALFTPAEYLSGKYTKYFQIMARRRKMPLTKFLRLKDWLITQGLTQEASPFIDILAAYYTWGFDGLWLPVTVCYRQSGKIPLSMQQSGWLNKENIQVMEQEIGLVNKTGMVFLPPHAFKSPLWQPVSSASAYQENYLQLQEGFVKAEEYHRCSAETYIEMRGSRYDICFSATYLRVCMKEEPQLRVYEPGNGQAAIATNLLAGTRIPDILAVAQLKALAAEIARQCKPITDLSSYKALIFSGCDIAAALYYIVHKAGLLKDFMIDEEIQRREENGDILLWVRDIEAFVQSEPLRDEAYELLRAYMDGDLNIDNISRAYEIEAAYSDDEWYKSLYAAYYILGIPLAELAVKILDLKSHRSQVTAAGKEEEGLVFSNKGYTLFIPCQELDFVKIAYEEDLKKYAQEQLKNASLYVYITRAARETGSETARRHVAMEGYYIDLRRGKVRLLLGLLKDKLAAEMEACEAFAATAFFTGALNGRYTYPAEWGGGEEILSTEAQAAYFACLEPFIESTAVYCNTNITVSGNFKRYCANGIVSPEYIIPRQGEAKIRESAFNALWLSWRAVNPQVYAGLIKRQAIDQEFIPWTIRWTRHQLVKRNSIYDAANLDCYYQDSQSFLKEVDEYSGFQAVPHPLAYAYPEWQPEFHLSRQSVRQRFGPVKIKIGETKFLRPEDYQDIIGARPRDRDSDKGIRPFRGYNARDFYFKPECLLLEYRPGKSIINVMDDCRSFYCPELGICGYQQLADLSSKKYPIHHLHHRKYVFRDGFGALWEAELSL